jgi:formate--tetrahydrofolate ligase
MSLPTPGSLELRPVLDLAREQYSIPPEHLVPYGHFQAKLSTPFLNSLASRPDGKLILVTAMSPTPAGEGKTTTTIGLGDALNRIGHRTMVCLREPSLGPCFGQKGGATGGGRAQVMPMEDINLHFTGDFHAIGAAHNLLAAMVDNHLHHGNALGLDPRRIPWRRVVDMNDRALRNIVIGLGGTANGVPRESGYDITVASEIMAILCLANSLTDLKERLGNIIIGYRLSDRSPVFARDLSAHGAMAALLKHAISPNLVQTLERNLALIHGGPFANIAHGCNSLIATRTALKLAGYAVTEAGFGADLGAQKFLDIKCRLSGLRPAAAVLVATVRSLKYQGGVAKSELTREDLSALDRGLVNVERHLANLRTVYGLPTVIAINHFTHDTPAELALLESKAEAWQVPIIVARHFAQGGAGAEDLARAVVTAAATPSNFQFSYPDHLSLWEKIEAIATRIYGAARVTAPDSVRKQLDDWTALYPSFPVCIAKTQYSFSSNPALLGAPTGHTLDIREVRLNHGAGFVVAICGDLMTMPGLPKSPAAERISIDSDGAITGLF